MKSTTIVMPVSRPEYVNIIFARLELLTCDRENTNLLVIVDGDVNLFTTVRNEVEMSKFNQRLCVQFKSEHKLRHYDYVGRRRRISDLHNELKTYVVNCDYVLGLEDDTIIRTDTLEKLLKDYSIYPYAGLIQGVQLGRWGIPYVGAWKLDDVYDPKHVESINPSEGIQEIDAGGFYCFLTKRDNYVNHDFIGFENFDFGPDVNYGVSLRRIGLMNYVDWNVTTIHKSPKGDVSLSNTEPRVVKFSKLSNNRWRQTKL